MVLPSANTLNMLVIVIYTYDIPVIVGSNGSYGSHIIFFQQTVIFALQFSVILAVIVGVQ